MLPPDFTEAVTRALETARFLAAQQNKNHCDPQDVLLSLILEEEGRAFSLLSACGCARARLRPAIELEPDSELLKRGSSLPFSAACQEAFVHARSLSRELTGERTVASDHLLLALVQVDAPLRQHLSELGLDVPQLEQRIRGVASDPLPLDEPLRMEDTAEQMSTARILDAAANRTREALRVLEDYTRFALDDAVLSRELKEMRHELAEALGTISSPWLLQARETQHDVGTTLHTVAELDRSSLSAVVQANLKRLQEALRTLAEYGKISYPQMAQSLERLRYRAYTVERALLLGTAARERLATARLYVLATGAGCAASLEWTIAEAAAGGADVIQLREKRLNDRELLERARKVRAWTRKANVLFVMNDRPDLARLVEADGVHLGQDDLPVKEARKIMGPDALIGVSTHNLDQVRQAVLDGASYLGVGPTFSSQTKEFEALAGLELVRQASSATTLPAFVLGGINRDTIAQAVSAGAKRVAVSHAICAAEEPCQAAQELRAFLS